MKTTHIPTLEQMESFVIGTFSIEFRYQDKLEVYQYVEMALVQCQYIKLTKQAKGIVRSYLCKITGYSSSQLSRLILQFKLTGRVRLAERTQPQFATKYTLDDVLELARIDQAHNNLSGPATINILKREYNKYGNQKCIRLKDISVSHLYNIRLTKRYRLHNYYYTKTKPSLVSIGERTRPVNYGLPGHIRVDTVHQGDKDGKKGVYHINLIDEVTQWEVVICVEAISERYMVIALDKAIEQFPFKIVGFHSDNGSEYINKVVAGLLNKKKIKLTKSRPRQSGDNGLVETKNGAVIRKELGKIHIPRTKHNVDVINSWYNKWFVPYLNFHRPCAFRVPHVAQNGKLIYKYPKDGYMTPYEKLKTIPNTQSLLKDNLILSELEIRSYTMSDTNWALAMQKAKTKLFRSLVY